MAGAIKHVQACWQCQYYSIHALRVVVNPFRVAKVLVVVIPLHEAFLAGEFI